MNTYMLVQVDPTETLVESTPMAHGKRRQVWFVEAYTPAAAIEKVEGMGHVPYLAVVTSWTFYSNPTDRSTLP